MCSRLFREAVNYTNHISADVVKLIQFPLRSTSISRRLMTGWFHWGPSEDHGVCWVVRTRGSWSRRITCTTKVKQQSSVLNAASHQTALTSSVRPVSIISFVQLAFGPPITSTRSTNGSLVIALEPILFRWYFDREGVIIGSGFYYCCWVIDDGPPRANNEPGGESIPTKGRCTGPKLDVSCGDHEEATEGALLAGWIYPITLAVPSGANRETSPYPWVGTDWTKGDWLEA